MFRFEKYLLVVYRYGRKTPAYYYFVSLDAAKTYARTYEHSKVHEYKIYKI